MTYYLITVDVSNEGFGVVVGHQEASSPEHAIIRECKEKLDGDLIESIKQSPYNTGGQLISAFQELYGEPEVYKIAADEDGNPVSHDVKELDEKVEEAFMTPEESHNKRVAESNNGP